MPTEANTESVVHRLHDMETEEVSLVDKAANRRKFLVVKRDAVVVEKVGAEIIAGENGEFTTVKPEPAGQETSTAKAATKLTAEIQTALTEVFDSCARAIEAARAQVAAAELVTDDDEVSADAVMEPMLDCCEVMEDALDALVMMGAGDAEQEDGLRESPSTEGADAAPAGQQMKRFGEVMEKRSVAKSEARAVVTKYGTKMAGHRLSRFEQAISTLHAVLSELKPAEAKRVVAEATSGPAAEVEAVTEKAAEPVVVEAPKAVEPTAASAEMQALAKKLAEAEARAKVAEGRVETAKRAALEAVRVAKSQAEQVAHLRGIRVGSNAVRVEGERRESSDYSWPLDMNATGEKAPRFGE